MWFVFALLSAVFAALTSILAKVGIDGVNSNLATAVRTVVVVLMAWGMVFLTNAQGGIGDISRKSWLFLILSGLATGASWLCYYKALQMGEASKVVPIDKLSVVITLVLAFVLEKFPQIAEKKSLYIGGTAITAVGILFSVYAAYISDWYDFMPGWVVKIDRILTGRIASIYAFENGGGVLENWKLFGDPDYIEYFDMGYVRLFFWYGIIPGLCCIILLFLLIWQCKNQKDRMGFVLILSFAVFTVVEAHIVSVYIARNYILFLLGAYWTGMFPFDGDDIYWWQLPGFY